MSLRIEDALRRTPLEPYVRLVVHQDDITRPRVESVEPERGGYWVGAVYLVDRRGLSVWLRKGSGRSRDQKFVATFRASLDPVTNMLRAKTAAEALRVYAKHKLACRARGLKSASTRKARKDPTMYLGGRPKGIKRSMERKGKNPNRLCPDCGAWPHVPKPCRPKGERP